jgi:hypothetical protein
MNRAVVQTGFAIAVFLMLAAASAFLTNTLFKAMATDRPTVTFSVVSSSATAKP